MTGASVAIAPEDVNRAALRQPLNRTIATMTPRSERHRNEPQADHSIMLSGFPVRCVRSSIRNANHSLKQ